MIRVIKVDPAGNITAIVRGSVSAEHRILVSKNIMAADATIEQVGFETKPVMGGHCRLEMAGGEFCGNATRAFGFLYCFDHNMANVSQAEQNSGIKLAKTAEMSIEVNEEDDWNSGIKLAKKVEKPVKEENWNTGFKSARTREVLVEISGAGAPVRVQVDLASKEAYTDMPLPGSIEDLVIDGQTYSLVHMDGIDHLIVDGREADEALAMELLSYLKKYAHADAYGILFLNGNRMVPLVYVVDIESLIWESSCGSGTCACTWYLLKKGSVKSKENLSFTFYEPGGILNTYIEQDGDEICRLWMGGKVELGS